MINNDKQQRKNFIGSELRALRLSAKLNQSKAAELANIKQPQLSMIENGKRSVSAELRQRLIEIYMENTTSNVADIFYTDDDNIAVRSIRLLQWFAKKSESREISFAVDNYICISAYIFLRKLYLVNPHNSERSFNVPCGTFEKFLNLVFEEPDKVVSYARASRNVSLSKLEPDMDEVGFFLKELLECEKFILSAKIYNEK